MTSSVFILQKENSFFKQTFDELVYSIKKNYSEEEISSLLFEILKKSGKDVYDSKIENIKNLFKISKKLIAKTYTTTNLKIRAYINNGFKSEFSKDLDKTKLFLLKIPGALQSGKNNAIAFYKDFLAKPREEKIEMLAAMVLAVAIFFVSAGGSDLEGGIPDIDLMFGVGFHRHIISHSFIIGLMAEFIMRSGIEVYDKIYQNLPKDHHNFWDKTHNFIENHKEMAVGAMWLGIGAHLIKDAGIFGHGVKPYVGLPFEMSMGMHQTLFAINGVSSITFAYYDVRRSYTSKAIFVLEDDGNKEENTENEEISDNETNTNINKLNS